MQNRALNIVFLAIIASVVALLVFPILGNMPIVSDEAAMLKAIADHANLGFGAALRGECGHVSYGLYCYFAKFFLNMGVFSNAFAVRLPGAIITLMLSCFLYAFVRHFDLVWAAFLAALMFLACGWVLSFTFTTTPALLPTAVLILSLVAQYQWLAHSTFLNYVFMLVTTTAMIAITTHSLLIFNALIGIVYIIMLLRHQREARTMLWQYLLMIPLVGVAAHFAGFSPVGELEEMQGMFSIDALAKRFVINRENGFSTFVSFAVFSIFPLSIPLFVSLISVLRQPKSFIALFHRQPLVTRYGIIIAAVALPSLFLAESATVMMLYASIFFNMLILSRYLMIQFNHFPEVWRISGIASAVVVVTGIPLAYFVLRPNYDMWAIALVVLVAIALYHLWRNSRDIGTNHRYLYNLIWLYLIASALFYGYMRPAL